MAVTPAMYAWSSDAIASFVNLWDNPLRAVLLTADYPRTTGLADHSTYALIQPWEMPAAGDYPAGGVSVETYRDSADGTFGPDDVIYLDGGQLLATGTFRHIAWMWPDPSTAWYPLVLWTYDADQVLDGVTPLEWGSPKLLQVTVAGGA